MLLLLLACAAPVDPPAASPQPEPWSAPGARGPYAVGVRTVSAPSALGDTLTVEVWYPAIADDRGAEYDLLSIDLGGEAHRDAVPDDRGVDWPVVAFSHGFGGIRFQSWFLTEHLASHGMVAVAPDHKQTTLLDFEPDGAGAGAPRRPRDIADAVDALADLDLPADTRSYAVVGHSFGAWTALVVGGGALDGPGLQSACEANDYPGCDVIGDQGAIDVDAAARWAVPDPRAKVTVALAPGAWYAFGADGAGLASVRNPLVLGGTRDGDLPWDEEGAPTWAALSAPRALALLEGAGHWGFTDLCALLPIEDCAGAAEGFMDPADVHAVTAEATTAWIRWHLSGSAGDEAAFDGAGWVVER